MGKDLTIRCYSSMDSYVNGGSSQTIDGLPVGRHWQISNGLFTVDELKSKCIDAVHNENFPESLVFAWILQHLNIPDNFDCNECNNCPSCDEYYCKIQQVVEVTYQ